MTNESRDEGKKIYHPPKVTMINLRPEEAVLGSCKTQSAAGPVSTGCVAIGGGACRGHGS